jgi:hypothetical protein
MARHPEGAARAAGDRRRASGRGADSRCHRRRHVPAGERRAHPHRRDRCPETHADQAKCATEIALGEAAAAGVRTLLDHRPVSFVRVGRSYNCSVARMTFAGRDLGAQRVARGVARWWPRGAPKPDWCGPERRR